MCGSIQSVYISDVLITVTESFPIYIDATIFAITHVYKQASATHAYWNKCIYYAGCTLGVHLATTKKQRERKMGMDYIVEA